MSEREERHTGMVKHGTEKERKEHWQSWLQHQCSGWSVQGPGAHVCSGLIPGTFTQLRFLCNGANLLV